MNHVLSHRESYTKQLEYFDNPIVLDVGLGPLSLKVPPGRLKALIKRHIEFAQGENLVTFNSHPFPAGNSDQATGIAQ